MSFDLLLVTLRIAIALSLYTFLGALFLIIWRDVKNAGTSHTQPQVFGQLVIVVCQEELALEIGRRYPLRPHTTIGRGLTNTLVFDDTFASAEHAHIILRKGQWWLEDQQSSNGTTLNDLPVTDPVVLTNGDMIGIGRVQLRLDLENPVKGELHE